MAKDTKNTNEYDYNEVVAKMRELARVFLRMKNINKVQTKIVNVKVALKSATTMLSKVEKNLTVMKYEFEQMDKEHPTYEDDAKCREEAIKDEEEYVKNRKTNLKAEIKSCEEQLEKHNEVINDYQTGKKKVLLDQIEAKAEELIDEFVKDEATVL